jgi:hypothetical protein
MKLRQKVPALNEVGHTHWPSSHDAEQHSELLEHAPEFWQQVFVSSEHNEVQHSPPLEHAVPRSEQASTELLEFGGGREFGRCLLARASPTKHEIKNVRINAPR